MTFERLTTRLEGLVLLAPTVHVDERGFLVETYGRHAFAEFGIDVQFLQDNHSRSLRGTLRGLHYQRWPGQAKLVRAARGRIWDVAVDVRRGSPTFGEWEAFDLDDVEHLQLYIPIGFAHGFCVISDIADVAYKTTSPYAAAEERGVAWDDPALGITWPVSHPILSARDRGNPPLAQIAPEDLVPIRPTADTA